MPSVVGCNELWEKCMNKLREKLSDEEFNTWLVPIIPIDFENNVLFLEVPTTFFYEWVSVHYSNCIIRAVNEIFGIDIVIKYTVKKENNVFNLLNTRRSKKSDDSFAGFINSNFADVSNITGLNDNYTFENFVKGGSNELARAYAESVAEKPLDNPFNPLMIYSEVGLGKTHLLHAIGNRIKKKFPYKKVIFIPSTVFVDQFINSIKNNMSQDFSRFYTSIDVLLLDDVQFLKDKIKTQENLFYIFNQLHQAKKQIVLTSDKPPDALEGLQERLVSRFKWGLMANIGVPDLETRIAILNKKFASDYNIPENVLEYIAQRVNSNIRELEGVMLTTIANMSVKHNIDIVSIYKIINNISSNDAVVDRISNAVSSYYRISIEDILGKSKKKNIALARQIAMYFAKKYTQCSLKTIGSLIGGRDHSTVVYAINNIENLMKTHKDIKRVINCLKDEIERISDIKKGD